MRFNNNYPAEEKMGKEKKKKRGAEERKPQTQKWKRQTQILPTPELQKLNAHNFTLGRKPASCLTWKVNNAFGQFCFIWLDKD